MKIAAPKYTRDFYPEDMQRREWIESAWIRASRAAGFQPWDGPILESLDLYKRKSGDEIVDQLFTLVTKGGDELAIRPEMTPTLARMIAARQSSLPRPIRWYTIGRMCRYERGQRGRLREFWQWNVDLLGVEGPIADAEAASVALDGLIELGLGPADVEARINSRALFAALLDLLQVPQPRHAAVFAVADKRGKTPEAELVKLFREAGLSDLQHGRLTEIFAAETLADVRRLAVPLGDGAWREELDRLDRVFEYLDALGKREFVRFDAGVVRGLAYYTGPVFEVFDKKGEFRALCGGGRYDRLMELMGGRPMPACGFGMGDVVLGELLAERGLAPPAENAVDYFLIPLEEERIPDLLRLAAGLRSRRRARVDYAMKPGNLSKLLRRASDLGAGKALLVGGREWASGLVRQRDLRSGEELDRPLSEFLDRPSPTC
jgi:histidyl-tRNA synthetase